MIEAMVINIDCFIYLDTYIKNIFHDQALPHYDHIIFH